MSPGVLNADILAIVASFLQRRELLQLALVSQAHRDAAYPCLYSNVHVESLAGLRAFAATVRRTPYLALCVRHFTEGVSRWRPLYAGVGPAQWREYTSTVLEMLERLPLMTHVALSASLDFCTDEDTAACHPKLLKALGDLTQLTALALTDVDYHFLDVLDVCAPLTILHVSPSHTQWTGAHRAHDRDEWTLKLYRIIARRHAASLVELCVPHGAAVERPEFAALRLPRLQTFMVPEGLSATPQLAAMCPNLRNLRLGVGPHALRAVERAWPALAHLELEACEPGLLGRGHAVRSLSLCVDRADVAKLVPSLASRRVESLRLRWEEAPPRIRDIVAYFPAVKYVELPMRLEWISKIMDPDSHPEIDDHWPQEVAVEVFNFFIMVLPPPPVGWDADAALKHILSRVYDSVRLIILSWIDADFTPHARMLGRDPSSDAFVRISADEAFDIASEYRYAPTWPRWSASSFCTELIG